MFAVFGPEGVPWLLSVLRVTLLALGCVFLTGWDKRGREWERAVPTAVSPARSRSDATFIILK